MPDASPKSQVSRHTRIAVVIVLAAAGLRLVDLGLKPPHFDEGINGWFVDRMTIDGCYRYDPTNFHGPLYFYLLQAAQTLFGRSIAVLRLPSALAGIGVVALALWGFRRHIGSRAALWFGGWLAVSPALVFVSRYAIHEMWLLLFLMLAALGLCERWAGGRRGAAWLVCGGVAGMVLTKETYVIHLICLGLAWIVWRGLQRVWPDKPADSATAPTSWRDFVVPGAVSLATVLFFYSGTLLNPAGIAGLWETFAAWTHTGFAASGHAKSWHYWIDLMARHEWAALIGLAAGARFLWPSAKATRILVIAGAGTLAAYSIVSYKTPWCVAVLLWTGPLALACLLDEVSRRGRRWLVGASIVGALLAGHDLWSALRLNWRHYDDPAEPYVYVQTFRDIDQVTGPLLKAARDMPLIRGISGHIVVDGPYPLPWVLAEFYNLAYLGPKHDLDEGIADSDFLLVDASRRAEVEDRLRGRFKVVELRLRDAHEPVTAYFREMVLGPWVTDEGRSMVFRAGGKGQP